MLTIFTIVVCVVSYLMNIKHRINARKIALSYFYQNCFFHFMQKGLQKTESESRSEVATETSTQNV